MFGIPLSLLGTGLAGIIAIFGRGKATHRVSMSVLAFSAAAGVISAVHALSQHTPFGVSAFSPIFFLILNVVTCLVAAYAIAYGERYRETYDLRSLDALTALFVLGMQGVLLAPTPLTFLLFWEVMSVASFFLVMADGAEESIHAALFYLIMTQLGAGALMAGFAILSGGSLSLTFPQIAMTARSVPPQSLTLAFVLLFFGFGSKAGLWPFHVWLPIAHPQAPSHVSALMSGVMLKMALYGFLLSLTLFPALPGSWGVVVIVIGLVTAIYGALYAVVDRDMKRTLAYSSMENLGLMFLMVGIGMRALALGNTALLVTALSAVVLHAAAHALFKAGLFMGAGTVVAVVHDRSLEKMGGLAKRMPRFSAAMLVLSLAAAALPPSGAFAAEWLLLQHLVSSLSGLSRADQVLFVTILAGVAFVSGLAMFAMVKLFGIAFLAQPRSEHAAHATEPSAGLSWPVMVAAFFTVVLGIGAPVFLRLARMTTDKPSLVTGYLTAGTTSLSPFLLGACGAVLLVAAYALRRLLSQPSHERTFHAWDCGQPITAAMEYTATAFSGPIRFFFRMLLRRDKSVSAKPVVDTNPWIVTRTFSLEIWRVWYEWLYVPVIRAALFASTWVRRLQNGVIQFYIALIVLALAVTVAIAL